jgi:hypothetical protein
MKLEGRTVLAYVDGGWTISGTVEKADKDKLILSVENKNDLYVIFRDKISIVKLIDDRSDEVKAKSPELEISKRELEEPKEDFPFNQMTYNENIFSLPRDLIKKDMQQELDDNDLSIMFSETSGGGIVFRRKDE